MTDVGSEISFRRKNCALKIRETRELGLVWNFQPYFPNIAMLKAARSLKPIPP